ncbi:hypothetical protein [Actinoalloteichus hymeniacidonis]|uniref:TrbL/VirB6 plasmid conjugal transfer protein n=1 Tax=Actinoalloteichus hymeniacidonis TaxID=340345 RepID=A0AAC9HTH9_9PSEU|nr:hypothetical protein [Actinoalloteichus hymeniacidonis]AOS65193.1 hypothetical protein TL08_22045 [Actinoalloteichus hymeniacidonis]MBB5906727.1 hypothetical protein [Actinoalloteichus hymeniacidonis]
MITLLLVLGISLLTVAGFRALRRRSARAAAGGLGSVPPGRRNRRRALVLVVAVLGAQVILGSPATGQAEDGCRVAPNPERPGSGMVGVLDPARIGTGQPGTVYDEVGYAGLVWHTYDLGCGPEGMRNPNALIDTWAGNQLFNVGKTLVGATNGLHYALLGGELMGPLDGLITTGTTALYDTVYTPLFGVLAIILGILMFRQIWRGDLAGISKRGMWALAAIWLAAATYLTPLIYTNLLDDILITGTSAVQAGFLDEVDVDERNALPELLHQRVVYDNWLRGEVGSLESPQADLGRDLVLAQAWTKEEVDQGLDAESPEEKQAAFHAIADQMGGSYGYFQGVDGSRMGAGLLATVQGFAYALFQLLAKAAILLAQVLLRVLILAGPIIGLIAMIQHELLRRVGRAVGAALLNVVVVSALAGVHTLILTWLFNPANGLELLPQMLLAILITVVLFMIVKPFRRMWQMVELSAGAVGGSLPKGPPGLFRKRREKQRTPQDDFWDQVRESEADDSATPTRGRQRVRPEAANPVTAAAERMDRAGVANSTAIGSGENPEVASSWSGTAAALPPGSSAGRARESTTERASTMAGGMPRGSRVVDTSPVTGGMDRRDDDVVVLPSRISRERGQADPANRVGPVAAPRRAEMEVVAGRPVFVVYRPSRGLEVRESGGDVR